VVEPTPSPDAPAGRPVPSLAGGALVVAGLAFLALGLLLGAGYLAGIRSSLLPTGWLFPLVLVATGALMCTRRRFDIVATLWGALFAIVLLLEMSVFMRALDQGFEDPAAFDATVIVAALGLVPLVLRPGFRS
jgi:hypothetical protein